MIVIARIGWFHLRISIVCLIVLCLIALCCVWLHCVCLVLLFWCIAGSCWIVCSLVLIAQIYLFLIERVSVLYLYASTLVTVYLWKSSYSVSDSWLQYGSDWNRLDGRNKTIMYNILFYLSEFKKRLWKYVKIEMVKWKVFLAVSANWEFPDRLLDKKTCWTFKWYVFYWLGLMANPCEWRLKLVLFDGCIWLMWLYSSNLMGGRWQLMFIKAD